MIQAMFANASDESLYFRFFHTVREVTMPQIQKMIFDSGTNSFTLLCLMDDQAVAAGTYTPTSAVSAEVALFVCDEFQDNGIGTLLLEHLADAASRRGINQFEACVLEDNLRMLKLLDNSGYEIERTHLQGVVHLTISLRQTELSRTLHSMRETVAILERDRQFSLQSLTVATTSSSSFLAEKD